MGSRLLYHVAITDDWDMSEAIGEYAAATRGIPYEPGGYIRATTAAGIQAVLDTHFADLDLPLTLVAIDADRLEAEGTAVEAAPPHGARIRGALRRDDSQAILDAAPLEHVDGRWAAPAAPADAEDQAAPDEHRVIEPSVLYVGTPAYLIATINPDGSPNLSAASSYWALGRMLVLGIENDSQTSANLATHGELVVSFPSAPLWQSVLLLSALTGRNPVPEHKQKRYRYEPDKFGAVRLTPQAADLVAPPRVRECLLQFEARVRRMTPGIDGGYDMVEAEVIRVHAHPSILRDGDGLIEPKAWHPLVYSFRHFFDRGAEVGWLASSATAPHPPVID